MSMTPFEWKLWRLGWAWCHFDEIAGWRRLFGRLWWCVDPNLHKLKV